MRRPHHALLFIFGKRQRPVTLPQTHTVLLMKPKVILLSALLLLSATSCSYNQATGASVGGMLGGIFGSAIGGIMGGPRGEDIGTLIGGLSGAAVGTAVGAKIDEQQGVAQRQESVRPPVVQRPSVPRVEVSRLRLVDPNRNHCLDRDERCVIMFELYNREATTLYHIAPILTCSSGNVRISPPAVISYLRPGQGMRYQAVVIRHGRARRRTADFELAIDVDGQRFAARTFQLRLE